MGKNIKIRLIVMNILQWAIWGAYLTSMGQYLENVGLGSKIGLFYAMQGIVSIFMPALMGIVADKWLGATKALALEVAARKVTVNAIAPGFIETDMTKELPVDELKKLVPMNRFGRPEEVAAAVGFLVSEDASYITGEVININGGLYT